jgi:hypothetical protein
MASALKPLVTFVSFVARIGLAKDAQIQALAKEQMGPVS